MKKVLLVMVCLCSVLVMWSQEDRVRLKEVPLTEDVIGEKKKFKFDFSDLIFDNKETKVYLVIRFCYQDQNFIVRKTVASPKFTYTQKYMVNQHIEVRANGYDGDLYCMIDIELYKGVLTRCHPLGWEIEWVKADSSATDFERS